MTKPTDRPGACDPCILERACCGECWCCPWPKWWTECHEAVTDQDGILEPCGSEIAGTAYDPEGGYYPVCRKHLRLDAAAAEARTRALAKVAARPRRYCHGCVAEPFIDGTCRPFRAAIVQAAILENC